MLKWLTKFRMYALYIFNMCTEPSVGQVNHIQSCAAGAAGPCAGLRDLSMDVVCPMLFLHEFIKQKVFKEYPGCSKISFSFEKVFWQLSFTKQSFVPFIVRQLRAALSTANYCVYLPALPMWQTLMSWELTLSWAAFCKSAFFAFKNV